MAAFVPPAGGRLATDAPRRCIAAARRPVVYVSPAGLQMKAPPEGAGSVAPVTVSRSGVEVHHFAPAVEALENEGSCWGGGLLLTLQWLSYSWVTCVVQ